MFWTYQSLKKSWSGWVVTEGGGGGGGLGWPILAHVLIGKMTSSGKKIAFEGFQIVISILFKFDNIS